MAGCNTGRNIQKYKGGGASTLQDALENGNTASLNINLSSPAVFVGDGGGLSNINASSTTGNLQAVTDNGATTTNKITFSNGITSLQTSGNALVTGNVTASFYRGDGGTLSNIAASKNFQEVTDLGATSSNKITLTNGVTSLQTSGNVSVTGNVTASKFYGDGKTLTGVALSTDLVSNSTRIGTVSTDLTSNASRIGVVETDLASNSTRIGTVSTDLASNASRIGVVETDLTNNTSRIGVLETDLASNSTRIGTVSTDLSSNATRVTNLKTDMTSNASRIGDAEMSILTLETNLAGNSTKIGVLETDLASNSTRIGTVSTDLASNSTRIGTVSTDLASNSSRIGTVSTDLASNSTRIGTVSTDLTSNASRISTLEGETQPVNRGGTGQTSYTVGQLLVASDTAVLSKLTPGTSGHFLKSQGSGNSLIWASVAEVGSATPGSLFSGSFLTGADAPGGHTGESNTTISVEATTTNTANKIVARDGSGDIFVQNLYTDGGIGLGHASDTTLARDSAGVATIAGAEIRTGTVPIGKGGTGQTTASAAASALGVGTEDSPQFTAIELGHASDTTLARDSAGVVTIEGAVVRTGTVARGDGGTGQTSYSTGDILYGASSGATLNKLSPAGSNADVGKFLKLGSDDEPEWATVSVSSTTISTTNVDEEDTDHGLIFVSDSGTGAQALKKEWGTLKYKPSSGTLTTSNVITSDTSIHARNGIANTTPMHTLDIGSNVAVIDDGIDKLYIRGNVYSTHDIISLGTVRCKEIVAVNSKIKNSTVVTEAPTRQVRSI